MNRKDKSIASAYAEMLERDKALADYRRFYGKDTVSARTEPYRYDFPSYLLKSPIEIVEYRESDDSVGFLPIGCKNNLTELIRLHESGVEYVSEGLIRSVSLEKFVDCYRNYCKAHLDKRLESITTDDIGLDRFESGLKLYNVHVDNEHSDFVTSVLLPVFSDSDVDGVIRSVVDGVYVAGWNIANITRIPENEYEQPFGDEPIMVLRLTFEKKFNDYHPKLTKYLYHVTTPRYLGKIMRNGLTPSAKSLKFKFPPRVYLFTETTMRRAMVYGLQKVELEKALNGGSYVESDAFYVLKIDTSKLPSDMVFYADPFYAEPFGGIDKTPAIFTYRNIPPQAISGKALRFDVDGGVAVFKGTEELSAATK